MTVKPGVPTAPLSYRIINPNGDVVEVPALAHLGSSKWTTRAIQNGIPGSATVGSFDIPIAPAVAMEFKRNKRLFDPLIDPTLPPLRIEGSQGDVPTKFPKFSGVITKVRPGLDAYSITGSDSLWWLQQSQLYPGEVIGAGGATSALFNALRSTREVVWDDDFFGFGGAVGGKHSAADYNLSGGFTFTSADPLRGQSAVTTSTFAAYINSKTTWNATTGPYNWTGSGIGASMIIAQGTIIGSTDTVDSGEIDILWDVDSTVQNGYLARAYIYQTGVGSGLWNVNCNIFTITGGTLASVAAAVNVMTGLSNTFHFELGVVLYNLGGNRVARVIINGKDANCVYSFNTAPSPASGGVGVRFSFSGGTPTIYVNRLRFTSRAVPANWGTARFGAGSISTGMTIPQNIISTGQTHMDVMGLLSTLDGFWIRKTAGYNSRGDTLDYGLSPGNDLSSMVVFEEGVNIDMNGTIVAPVSDLYASESRVLAVPGFDSGGSYTWSRIQDAGDMVLTDTISDIGVPGFLLLAAYAQVIAARKANPLQAIQLSVVRDENSSRWRELDFVTVHIPSLGIFYQKAQIVGYTYTEKAVQDTVWLNQFPDALVRVQLERIKRSIEWMTSIVNR